MQDLLAATGSFETVATAKTEGEANLWLEDHPAQWDLTIVDMVLEQGSGFGVWIRVNAIAQRHKAALGSSEARLPTVFALRADGRLPACNLWGTAVERLRSDGAARNLRRPAASPSHQRGAVFVRDF